MANKLWRAGDRLVAYVEDPEVMRKIKRSYPDFVETTQYHHGGKLIARQYNVPSERKRSARRLLGVNVER